MKVPQPTTVQNKPHLAWQELRSKYTSIEGREIIEYVKDVWSMDFNLERALEVAKKLADDVEFLATAQEEERNKVIEEVEKTIVARIVSAKKHPMLSNGKKDEHYNYGYSNALYELSGELNQLKGTDGRL